MSSLPLFSLDRLSLALVAAVRIVMILVVAFILVRMINKWVPKLKQRIVDSMLRHGAGSHGELEKQAATLGGIFRRTLSVLIWTGALVMSLKEAGFDIGPILAGAGVVGLAVGFGAQNLVRDTISGLFMLIENQVRVNDVAVINGTSGLVEEINLRTTVLRGADGTVHVFPNGVITSLSNMTREYSYYVLDIGVAYKEDTDNVMAVLKDIAAQMMKEDRYNVLILEPLEVLGVDRFAESAVIIKARIKTLPIQQWTVGREMNRRIKKRFDELGIEIPFPQRTLYLAGAPGQADPEQLKTLVREVLDERAAPARSPGDHGTSPAT
ncbi:MAG TPA: mechanosensitive ion channel family protein [Bryobacteraceae bacterium]|nr:mechanosensitive ion channel family protein [Bryobacteraceae bacterium]